MLILDEATAMFDPQGERDFIAQCHDLLPNRTALPITHRPASLALADRVLVLKNGALRAAWRSVSDSDSGLNGGQRPYRCDNICTRVSAMVSSRNCVGKRFVTARAISPSDFDPSKTPRIK